MASQRGRRRQRKVYRFIQGQEQEELRNVSIRILFFLRFAIASLHVYVQVEEDALSVRAEHQHAAYKATIDHSFVRVQGPDRLFKHSSCSVGVGLGGVHFIQRLVTVSVTSAA